jgi:lysozyme family protein
MAAASFDRCLGWILLREGGYVDDPADAGGATNMGITRATLAGWRGASVTAEDVRALTRDEAGAIYWARYWIPIRGDDLPAGVDLVCLDAAVMSGTGRAARMLQQAVGAEPDGAIGPLTLAAAGAADPEAVILAVSQAREDFYRAIARRDPSQQRFLKGWIARVDLTRGQALVQARPDGDGGPAA